MHDPLKAHIAKNFNDLSKQRLLVACSGGVDSVVLTRLLVSLEYSIALAHCNFSLRGDESDADERFVEALAKELGCPFHSIRFHTHTYAEQKGISTQMAARELRYDWFFRLLESEGYDCLLTAHHADDDFETFLINTLRGTGLRGLTGIPEYGVEKKIRRPLLPFSRVEIETTAKENNWAWREDSSNQSTAYLRNKLRHEVVPKLKEAEPQLSKNFQTTRRNLQNNLLLLQDYVDLARRKIMRKHKGETQLSLAALQSFPHWETLLYELLRPYGFSEDASALVHAQSGKQLFSETHVLLRDRAVLIVKSEVNVPSAREVYTITEKQALEQQSFPLLFEEVSAVEPSDPYTIFVDAGRLQYPLTLRHWERGDVFHPFGMQGKKKISKFFKDEKLSLFAKSKIWLLCSGDQIVWVVGLRADARFQVTPKTQTLIKITYCNA